MADSSRYTRYIQSVIADKKITSQERQKIFNELPPALKTANDNYKKSYDDYRNQITTLADQLSPSELAQKCDEIIQKAQNSQISSAQELVPIPGQMCTEFDSALAKFETILDAAYVKVRLPVPK